MIYLIYITKETGELVWSFRHPLSPTDLISNIAGKDDILISGLISAISSFGSETLGDRLQSIDFEKYTLQFRYLPIKDQRFLVAVVADKNDASEAVWNTITEFFKKFGKELAVLSDELAFMKPERQKTVQIKLNRQMTRLLDAKKRRFESLAYRNNKTVGIGLIPTLITFFTMYFVVDRLNAIYRWLPNPSEGWAGNVSALIGSIILLMFILPSLIMGYTVGFREGARKGGLGLSAIGLIVLSVRYYNELINWANNLGVLYLLPFLLLIVIYILGVAMGSIGSYVAWHFVEKKTLTPPEEAEIISEVEKLLLEEEVLEGISAPKTPEIERKEEEGEDLLKEIERELGLGEEKEERD